MFATKQKSRVISFLCILIFLLFSGKAGAINPQDVTALENPPPPAQAPFTEDFESGELAGYWSVNSTGGGRIQVSEFNGPAQGRYHVVMDSAGFRVGSLNELILTIDLAGYSGVRLGFQHKEFGDEDDPMPDSFSGSNPSDGVAVSADGVTWYKVQGLGSTDGISSQWQYYEIGLDAAAAAAGISFNDHFQIKFQQYGRSSVFANFLAFSDGFAFDDIEVWALIDTDADGLPDDWETTYFDNFAQAADDDDDDDGLNNGDEYLLDTDPTNADTDADRMPDGWEAQYNLDPLNPDDAGDDTDSDGRTNLQEYLDGTDPTRPPPAQAPFTEDFESGELAGYWSVNSTGGGRIQVSEFNGPAQGRYHVVMDSAGFRVGSLNELILTIDLAGYSGVRLGFQHKEFGDEDDPMPDSFSGSNPSDGVAVSADGVTWYKVQGLGSTDGISSQWQYYEIGLDAAAAAAGISFNDHFQIKFQQYGRSSVFANFLAFSDGFAFDDIEVKVNQPSYAVRGTILSVSKSVGDSDVNDPQAPSTSNDTFDEAQEITNPISLAGYVNVWGRGLQGRSWLHGDTADYFKVNLVANQTINLYIADPANSDLNLFLYDENKKLIDSAMGANAIESLTVPADGSYYIEVFCQGGASNYNLVIGQSQAATKMGTLRLSDEFVPGQAIVRFKDKVLLSDNISDASPLADKLRKLTPNSNMIKAKLKAMLLKFDTSRTRETILQALGTQPADPHLKFAESAGALIQLKLQTLQVIKDLRTRPEVQYAEPNYLRRPMAVPNDELYNLQWNYSLINLPKAWDLINQGDEVIVAVIDTGVLSGHPDMAGRMVDGYDFIRNPSVALDGDGIDSNADDPGDQGQGGSSFHGTHVAGTIAAATDNQKGGAGVAWSTARIMPLRALGKGGGTSYDEIQAVRYAAGLENDSGTTPSKPADIINLSLGGDSPSEAERAVFEQARNEGIIVVAAAGNNARNALTYPASYEGVISVSAVDLDGKAAYYSNSSPSVDVAAPGGDLRKDLNGDGYADGVLSTAANESSGSIQMGYAYYQGTSMATPHVSGVFALMKALYPGLTPDELDALLADGTITDDLGTAGRDDVYGYGLIDALKAVVAANDLANAVSDVPTTLVVNPGSLNFGEYLTKTALMVRKAGRKELSIAAVDTDAEWLTVLPLTVDGDGLGTYEVTVERSGLTNGTYSATIHFDSTANSVNVAIIIQVIHTASQDNNAGYLHVVLMDADTLKPIAEVGVEARNGAYEYAFGDIAPGTYRIYAGTDNDNDGFIGDSGEAFGAYLTTDQPVALPVNRDMDDLDFGIGFEINLSPKASLAGEKEVPEKKMPKVR